MNKYSRSELESLKEQIDSLDVNEHKQIYNIIKSKSCDVTKTKNGVLVSTKLLDDTTIGEIKTYVNFCIAQQNRIDTDTKARNVYERIFNDA